MERTTTWNNVGVTASQNDFDILLKEADLDYTAVASDLFTEYEGSKLMIPNKKVIMREDTKEVFGVVGEGYKICQNRDALDFVRYIEGIELQKAGSHGSMMWMIGKLPEINVLGDSISPNLIFQNSHDGSCSIRTTICMLRIVCQNQFTAAFKNSPATVRVTHQGDIGEKLLAAKETMMSVYDYIQNYDSYANEKVMEKLSPAAFDKLLGQYFQVREDASQRSINFMEEQRAQFLKAYHADDNQNFIGTKWGVINAFSDFATHREAGRKTETWEMNRFIGSLNSNPMDSFLTLVEAA